MFNSITSNYVFKVFGINIVLDKYSYLEVF